LQHKLNPTTIALAGIVQAVSLVKDLAHTGQFEENAFKTSLHSIFSTHPEEAISVFGEIKDLEWGLEKLIYILDNKSDQARLITRYMLSLMNLQKKISRSPLLLTTLTKRIQQVKKQVDYFSITHPTVIGNLADIYVNTVSSLRLRFFIVGNQQMLNKHDTMNKIRALLLAAVRASVLWRQMGGSRFHLLFSREKIKHTAETLLKELK
jgi:high frequency lysogenization protein